MIEAHFGLRRRPFPASPDHACYYPATGHEAALNRLLSGLTDGEGILTLTGPPGLGKTLLAHGLLDRLGVRPGEAATLEAVYLVNTHGRDRASLLQAILYDLSLPHEGRGEQEMRLALIDHLLKRFAAGSRLIMLIDEAHHLGMEQLEELRMLGNLEGQSSKVVQVVLIGQPELLDTLARPELVSLRQRVAVRVSLEPLGVEESADYLLHQLRTAGARAEELIDAEALELLARNTHGIPRLLNQAARQALRLAAESELTCVEVEVVLEALTQLGLPGVAPDIEESVMLVDAEGSPAEELCRLFGRTA